MIRWAIFAFALGCAWLQTRPELPALGWAGGLPLAGLLLAWVPRAMRVGPGMRSIGFLLIAFAAGFFYAAWRAEMRLADVLPEQWAGRDIALTGRVVGLPEVRATGVRFVLGVAAVSTPGAVVPERIQLGWYGRHGEPRPAVATGDCLHLVVRLGRPHGSLNPGGFDYEAWLLERRIRATGTLIGLPVPGSGCGASLAALVDRARERARLHLSTALAGKPYAGVVTALAVGDQDAIPSDLWTLFRKTGTSHLFSVSGLHITLFSALVYGLVGLVWRRIPGLNLRLPARRAGVAMGLMAATGYALLAGFGIPAQRTLFMLMGAAAVAWLDRSPTPSRLLAAALLAVVLMDPWAALAPGFWLSFGAVAALLFAGMGRLRRPPPWRAWARAQWAVTLGLTPLLLALFHEVSLVSPLANAVAIPLISLVAVPGALLAAISPWDGVAWLTHGVVWCVMWVLQALAALPRPVMHGAPPGLAALLLAVLGGLVLLLPRGVPGRWLGLLLCLPLFFPCLPHPEPGEFWLDVVDVGQGESVLVRTRAHALLVDGGPRYVSGEDAGGRVVAPYLWGQGINRLDGVVLTHDDTDHSGGLGSLLASHRPGWFLTSLAGLGATRVSEYGASLLASRPDALPCLAGQSWQWDGVVFRVLHPPGHHYAQSGYSDNDRGCVIRAQGRYGSALLTADVERLAEMNMAERGVLGPADVLVVPHHGSKSSSSPAFLAAVRPRLALIPVGYRNRYGHPHPEVLARYRALAIPLYRTDRDGEISVHIGGKGIEVEDYRQKGRRYWHEFPTQSSPPVSIPSS